MRSFFNLACGLIAALLSSTAALAQEVVVIDDALEVLPAGYVLLSNSSANATASIVIGDVGGSNGLVFDGSWDVPANVQEFAIGAMAPQIPTVDDFQLDPGDIDGIVSIRWMLDLAVISNTMVPPEQGIFVQLVIFQHQGDGTILPFGDAGFFVQAGDTAMLDLTVTAEDFGQPGARPDFSPGARPLSFGLQLGAAYPRDLQPDAFFVDGRMTADNWKVTVTGGLGGLFKDGFEDGGGLPPAARQTRPPTAVCNCDAPAALLTPAPD